MVQQQILHALYCYTANITRYITNYIFLILAPQHWRDVAKSDIETTLNIIKQEQLAKNVILFIGDGLDLNTITATRIYKYKNGETQFLAFEKFTNIGLLKTYSANKLVPDSCSTATALFAGVKVNHKTVGVDATIQRNDCDGSLKSDVQLPTIFDWAQESGKATGKKCQIQVTLFDKTRLVRFHLFLFSTYKT